MFVGVFNHDHRGVNHHPDGQGDATQTHDVGADVELIHDTQRNKDPQGQGDNGHQGAAKVEQEDDADQGHHHHLFNQFLF